MHAQQATLTQQNAKADSTMNVCERMLQAGQTFALTLQ
jgi:hypothetical protein